MVKRSQHGVVPEMRERLMTNRSGKLTVGQWGDIVMQPLMSLLVMMIPLLVILPRLVLAFWFGWWLMIGVLMLLAVTTVFRAYRYARLPVYHAKLQADGGAPPFWMFWKSLELVGSDGTRYKFTSRLAPAVNLERDKFYDVYYLKDADRYVLLSIAPIDHPDAERWQPDRMHKVRLDRRHKS